MKKRHKIIIKAFRDLGGKATLGELSEKTGLHVNRLSQSMYSMGQYINLVFLGGRGKDQKYEIKD
ncbi:hypothetical protein COW86_00700 [Candidatus Kuenenbacteria bacterium CG22_combo_CG10-13_8_21_14_all_39_9]|uniref:HTH iclR-type domain-containing protein n=1 Tax=Candidatus Kuenenbacteria bacterium CG22_combo_CG10-13_8_21_14_all_39_9 TaxID=1974621 RepID=A0A2H0D1H3_9BACT|nr:MAG: hypothetical protein COW86_00700 [Candidatus Kuenenbacteria bacterium CG22_combo_CG10-13_8_21_14_all_39_9]